MREIDPKRLFEKGKPEGIKIKKESGSDQTVSKKAHIDAKALNQDLLDRADRKLEDKYNELEQQRKDSKGIYFPSWQTYYRDLTESVKCRNLIKSANEALDPLSKEKCKKDILESNSPMLAKVFKEANSEQNREYAWALLEKVSASPHLKAAQQTYDSVIETLHKYDKTGKLTVKDLYRLQKELQDKKQSLKQGWVDIGAIRKALVSADTVKSEASTDIEKVKHFAQLTRDYMQAKENLNNLQVRIEGKMIEVNAKMQIWEKVPAFLSDEDAQQVLNRVKSALSSLERQSRIIVRATDSPHRSIQPESSGMTESLQSDREDVSREDAMLLNLAILTKRPVSDQLWQWSQEFDKAAKGESEIITDMPKEEALRRRLQIARAIPPDYSPERRDDNRMWQREIEGSREEYEQLLQAHYDDSIDQYQKKTNITEIKEKVEYFDEILRMQYDDIELTTKEIQAIQVIPRREKIENIRKMQAILGEIQKYQKQLPKYQEQLDKLESNAANASSEITYKALKEHLMRGIPQRIQGIQMLTQSLHGIGLKIGEQTIQRILGVYINISTYSTHQAIQNVRDRLLTPEAQETMQETIKDIEKEIQIIGSNKNFSIEELARTSTAINGFWDAYEGLVGSLEESNWEIYRRDHPESSILSKEEEKNLQEQCNIAKEIVDSYDYYKSKKDDLDRRKVYELENGDIVGEEYKLRHGDEKLKEYKIEFDDTRILEYPYKIEGVQNRNEDELGPFIRDKDAAEKFLVEMLRHLEEYKERFDIGRLLFERREDLCRVSDRIDSERERERDTQFYELTTEDSDDLYA